MALLASGSNARGVDESEVLLWDVAKAVHPEQPDYRVFTNVGLVSFERDGSSFLALAEGMVTRFDLETLRPVASLPEYGSNNGSLAVSWDGRWLAHAETNGWVHLCDREARQPRRSFCPRPGAYPGEMRILAQGHLLGTRLDAYALNLWDTESWQQPEPWRSLNAVTRGACVTADASRDGRFLATGQNDGRVFLWEVKTRDRLALFEGHRQIVFEVAFSPDGRWLASASRDGALKLYDVGRHREVGEFRGPATMCYGITFSPDGRRVANGGLLGPLSVVLWDVATRQHLTALVGPGRFFFAPRFSPDGQTLAARKPSEGITCLWRVPALEDIDREGREEGEGRREQGEE